jgi:CHASE2 domain-containing sensor protein
MKSQNTAAGSAIDWRRIRAAAWLAVAPLLVGFLLYASGLGQFLALRSLDIYNASIAKKAPPSNIVIVGYTDEDLEKYTLDVIENDETKAKVLSAVLAANPEIVSLNIQSEPKRPPGTKALRDILARDMRVFAVEGVRYQTGPVMRAEIPELAAGQRGHSGAVSLDPDGISRRFLYNWVPPPQKTSQRRPISLHYAVVERYLANRGQSARLQNNSDGSISINGKPHAPTRSHMGEYTSDNIGTGFLIPTANFADTDLISYSEILSGQFDPARLRGKIVLIGAINADLERTFAMPFQWSMFSRGYEVSFNVDLAAHNIAALLAAVNADWPVLHSMPGWFKWPWLVAWIFMLCWLLVPIARPWQWLAIGIGMSGALVLVTYSAYRLGYWLPVAAPMLCIFAATAMTVVRIFRAESSMRDFVGVTQRILNRLPEPVFVKDSMGKLRLVNESFCHLAKALPKELLNRQLTEVFPHWESPAQTINALAPEAAQRERFVDRSGRSFELTIVNSRLPRPGRQDLVFGLIRNFTPVGSEHYAIASVETMVRKFDLAYFWAQNHHQSVLVELLEVQDHELLAEAYSASEVDKLMCAALDRLRRAFPGADALERGQAGRFWLVRRLDLIDDHQLSLQNAIDMAFAWPFDVAGEKVELQVCAFGKQAPKDGEQFSVLADKIIEAMQHEAASINSVLPAPMKLQSLK